MIIFYILFVLLAVAALAAIELASLPALAAAGVIVAVILMAKASFLQGVLQLIALGAMFYLIDKLLRPSFSNEASQEKGYLSSAVGWIFIIAALVIFITIFKTIPVVPASLKIHDLRSFDLAIEALVLLASLVGAFMIIGKNPWRDK